MCQIRLFRCAQHEQKIHALQIYKCEGCPKPPLPPPVQGFSRNSTEYIFFNELHLTQDPGCEGFQFPFPVEELGICVILPSTRTSREN
ncbi:uncharacterized protein PG986_003602 [Apiospora aurea]|uniref:Uncharacterized protein n=1 Tax=Apiospora aurea TaxID=335848 RepID=A0ABR1QS53_9PEZI